MSLILKAVILTIIAYLMFAPSMSIDINSGVSRMARDIDKIFEKMYNINGIKLLQNDDFAAGAVQKIYECEPLGCRVEYVFFILANTPPQ